jgi:kynurenine formamidase
MRGRPEEVRARLARVLRAAGPLVLLTSCAGPPSGEGRIDLQNATVIDLTYPFDQRTIYWPTAPSGFELKTLHAGVTEGGFYYSSYAFSAPEHGGTHFDAPVHFAEGKAPADQVPLRRLIGRGVVIDVRRKAEADRDYRLTAADVLAWEERHGRIPPGAIVLLRTGWGARWPDRLRYLGDDRPGEAGDLHFPSYGREAAELLVGERRVGALGVDTASIDHGPSRDFAVHRVAAAAGVPGLENLAGLEAVPETGAWIVALPMKIAGGSGGPLRIVAIIPK